MTKNKYEQFVIETGQMLRFASWNRNKRLKKVKKAFKELNEMRFINLTIY